MQVFILQVKIKINNLFVKSSYFLLKNQMIQQQQNYLQSKNFSNDKGNYRINIRIYPRLNEKILFVEIIDFDSFQSYFRTIDCKFIQKQLKTLSAIDNPEGLFDYLTKKFEEISVYTNILGTISIKIRQANHQKDDQEYEIRLKRKIMNKNDILDLRITKVERDLIKDRQRNQDNTKARKLLTNIVQSHRAQINSLQQISAQLKKSLNDNEEKEKQTKQKINQQIVKLIENNAKQIQTSRKQNQQKNVEFQQLIKEQNQVESTQRQKFQQAIQKQVQKLTKQITLVSETLGKLPSDLKRVIQFGDRLRFADHLKGKDLTIEPPFRAIKKKQTQQRIWLLEPELGTHITHKTWKVKVESLVYLVGVGIASLDMIKANNFTWNNPTSLNHGGYFICTSGASYSSFKDEHNCKSLGPAFGSGDTIEVTYDSIESIIRFRKIGQQKNYVFPVNPGHKGIHAAVNLHSIGDSVQISE